MIKEIEALGLDATGLDIKIDGDKVSVGGSAVSQEMKEKVILAVGNVEGVAAVDDTAGGDDPVFQTVEKGDTLWAIRPRRWATSAATTKSLKRTNRFLGQVLRIPAK